MKWSEVDQQQCSVARSSAVLGDRWTLLILSDAFLGVRRFEDFKSRLGMSRATLTDRLDTLVEHDVLKRVQYREKPPRFEYRFTDKGLDLYPVLTTLVNWGDKYYSDKAGPPILRQHLNCGHDIQPVLACPDCGEPVHARNMRARKRPANTDFAPVVRGPIAKERGP